MAGVSRLQYANEIRVVRVMCSGRVDLEFILQAFSTGHDGVFIGGCKLGECNYVTQGNYDALAVTYLSKMMLSKLGINQQRVRTQFMNASDGILLAEVINDFSRAIKKLGRLGEAEGIRSTDLEIKLKAARKIVPYIRLVERERLRMPLKSKAEYDAFFTGEEFKRLFDELIGQKLAMSEIILRLREKSLASSDLSKALGLSPSEVSQYILNSSKFGFVKYDEANKSFRLA